jgi:pimeloyl-ACP methyl ester carboxylesterase
LSSYRKNGTAVKEGALDTRIAQATFTSQFGQPGATYLLGWSMGGAVGHQLVAAGAPRYAGFLSICSDQAGATRVNEYWLDARVLFDYYFPGVLPWGIRTDQAGLFLEVLPAIQGAFIADPAGLHREDSQTLQHRSAAAPPRRWFAPHLILTALGSLSGFGGGNAQLVEYYGGLPVGNADRVYTSDALSAAELADINANVARYEPDRGAEQKMLRLSPTGRLHGTPLLALHTDGDPVVPPFLADEFAQVAEAAGSGDLYVLRVVPGFGHCELTPDFAPDGFIDIQIQAFDDLVAWSEEGIKPAP